MFARGSERWIAGASVVPVLVGGLTLALSSGHAVAATASALLVPISVAFFFRDPDREPEGDGVVSPADGRVTVLRTEENDDGGERVRLGVFMNVHDVHVNRLPVGGTVESVQRHEGGYKPAFSKDSERNERVLTTVDTGVEEFEVVQIAGAFARRITTYLHGSEGAERAERLGLIAFGSRADIVFPPEYGLNDLEVGKGDKLRAGETVVAPCPSDEL